MIGLNDSYQGAMAGKKNLVGLKICEMRQQRRWTHHKLAVELAMFGLVLDADSLKRIESQDEFVSVNEVLAFATVFGVSIDELVPKDIPLTIMSQMTRPGSQYKPISHGCDDDGFGPN